MKKKKNKKKEEERREGKSEDHREETVSIAFQHCFYGLQTHTHNSEAGAIITYP